MSHSSMSVTLSRTIRPQQYESKKFEVTIHPEDYPEALELQGDERRRYLQFQAYRALGSFEIIEGFSPEEVQAQIAGIRRFLRIDPLLEKMPAAPPPPAASPEPNQATPATPAIPTAPPTPAAAKPPPAEPTRPEDAPLPPPRRGDYPDQTVIAAGHSVPEFGTMLMANE